LRAVSEMSQSILLKQDFNFEVPSELVAQNPIKNRDEAKLLVYKCQQIQDSHISHLADSIPENSLIIFNNSKVIPSRIRFKTSSNAQKDNAEILLLEPVSFQENPSALNTTETWRALARPIKKLKLGLNLDLGHGLNANVVRIPTSIQDSVQAIDIELSLQGLKLTEWLNKHGEMPLPPYIERRFQSAEVAAIDRNRYQTIYAEGEGSVAAPTAGLHFTDRVLESLQRKNCKFQYVTLHVGPGTFLPVKSNVPAEHQMHSERFFVPESVLSSIIGAKHSGTKVIAVGTTSFRCLEGLSAIAHQQKIAMNQLADRWLRTDIFIYPRNRDDCFKSWFADAIMTNFHQPESTLFMLVCSLIGYNQAKELYSHAIAKNYRFFSYGDSSLLWL
jgi:S-adenosylmethionine:tRNA ribosyltransferase-isomerase